MSKFGSPSAWLLVDGYNLAAAKLQGISYKVESLTEPSHGIGDAWEETLPTGVTKATVTQEGAFFDTGSTNIHAAIYGSLATAPADTPRIVCMGFSGHTTGETFIGFEGAYSQSYEVLSQVGKIVRANATYEVTGAAERGVILHPLASTTGAAAYNAGSSSTDGGSAYLQVTALNLGVAANVIVTVRDSSDDITYADLVAFAATTGIQGQRVEVTGDVQQYLAHTLTWSATSGSPTITYFVGFSRI